MRKGAVDLYGRPPRPELRKGSGRPWERSTFTVDRLSTAAAAPLAIGCAVLAAGAGMRFGTAGSKLVAPLRGRPLVQYAIDAACGSSATRCSLILGAEARRVLDVVDARRAAIYYNEAWRSGLSSTVRTALHLHAKDDACILMLGDAPHVGAGELDTLIDAWLAHKRSIIALRSGDVWGAPILFPRADYAALRGLAGDKGAKGYALAHLKRVTFVDASSALAFADVDRQNDLKRLNADGSRRTRRSRSRR